MGMDACTKAAKFEESVGKLDKKEGLINKLSQSWVCRKAPISFFNGHGWKVPTAADAQASAYTQTDYSPVLNLEGSPFPFCVAALGESEVGEKEVIDDHHYVWSSK